jgi:negative regulator of replication initiation
LKPVLYFITGVTQQPGASYRVITNIKINTNTNRKLQLIEVVQIQTQVSETALAAEVRVVGGP